MDFKLIRATAIILGVPGVALVIFYLLLKPFGFTFDTIGPTFSAIIALVFLLIVGSITAYALHLWAPKKPTTPSQTPDPSSPPQ